MFVTVASYKGGVGKTTTAVHFAAYFQDLAPTILIDGDPNRCVSAMSKRGGMPFTIADEREGLYAVRNYRHVIVDTEARPGAADFEDLARGCDLLVGAYNVLDLTPKGRDEGDAPQSWVRYHDRYED